MLPTSVSYAQFWEAVKGIAKGVGSAMLENYIDNNSSYSSEVKQSIKNDLNTINNAINTNQNAANATRDAYNGNYTGAVIQGAQTIMNATGNYQYDTYLNGANQINKANREYKQDIQNGMDRESALDKRNTTISYSAAESIIELQDKIARERLEKARQQREAERQSWENNNYYSEPDYYETASRNTTSNTKAVSHNVPEASWQILRDYGAGNKENVNQSTNEDIPDEHEASWQILRDYAAGNNEYQDIRGKVNENREYNKNAQILSSNNIASFLSDEGKSIYLYVLDDTNGGTILSFYNHDDNERRFVCNKVSIKLKYVGDDVEQIITDACSFTMPPHTSSILDWSDIFFNVSDTRAVESIKIQFVDTQIR